MKKTKLIIVATLFALMFVIAGCSETTSEASVTGDFVASQKETVYKVGSILPLTGDGAVYGIPAQNVVKQAVLDLNAKWKNSGKKLEVIYEDGKCSGQGGLLAAQSLINVHGVDVILGGACSSETLGLAPFMNTNKKVAFSGLSSSPEITSAGDYIFRNYPSDTAQVEKMSEFILSKNVNTVAILSENSDYAQALRKGYENRLTQNGISIVADEVIPQESRDIRTQVAKIKRANPDIVILLPQTIPTGILYAEQLIELQVEAMFVGNDVFSLPGVVKELGSKVDGWYAPKGVFENEEAQEFVTLVEQSGCDLGVYCATVYDSVILLGEILETCGDSDAECIKNELYAVSNWEGLSGTTTIDENGDVSGNFKVVVASDGDFLTVR